MPSLATPKIFFDKVRPALFHGEMTQTQVDGCNTIIGVWPPRTDKRWAAYGLATAWWETDFTMKPVPEIGKGRGHPYGLVAGPDGQVYYGRGYVQLTWRANYVRAANEIPGSNVYLDPDRALDPTIAAEIMTRGMIEGWFTRTKLNDFFPLERPEDADWLRARRIINGMDHAEAIGHAAEIFWGALDAAGYVP